MKLFKPYDNDTGAINTSLKRQTAENMITNNKLNVFVMQLKPFAFVVVTDYTSVPRDTPHQTAASQGRNTKETHRVTRHRGLRFW